MPAVRELINTLPTKRLFIEMLVKDVDLTDAIIDLVDNSIDGAKRIREDENFADLKIEIKLSGTKFSVKDNCGGIPLDIGKKYAFRFGRPKEVDPTPHSIGRFGIGMKRALFKLGKNLKVKTTSSFTKYSITVDVPEWSKDDAPETWNFQTDEAVQPRLATSPYRDAELGTTIEVTNLYPEIAKKLGQLSYVEDFRNKLRNAQNSFLNKGLTIVVNDTALVAEEIYLLQDAALKSSFKKEKVKTEAGQPAVNVKYYVGLQTSSPADQAGWYVYCNGRMILRAERSEITGWGETSAKIPRYHNQYARFRGYVFFDCTDSELLPWNTTKTGVDRESPIYAKARRTMVELMEPIVRFIDAADNERDTDDKAYTVALSQAKPVSIGDIRTEHTFTAPARNAIAAPMKLTRITFQKPTPEFDKVKNKLGATSAEEVGIMLFDYYKKFEIE